MISNGMKNRGNKRVQRFTAYKATPAGRYYYGAGGPLLKPADDQEMSTLKAECRAITKYLHENYGNSVDEYEAAYQDKLWLPEVITAHVLNMRRNGRPGMDSEWWDKQREMGYCMPEIVQLSMKTDQDVEEVKFYEGDANRVPRRLSRPIQMELDIDGEEVVEDDTDNEENNCDDSTEKDETESDDDGVDSDETGAAEQD